MRDTASKLLGGIDTPRAWWS